METCVGAVSTLPLIVETPPNPATREGWDLQHLKACWNLHCLGFPSFHPALPTYTSNCNPLTSLSVLLVPSLRKRKCTVSLLASMQVS